MSIAKNSRARKRQLGQFLTPLDVATRLVRDLRVQPTDKVLEPSMGDGSFIIPLIEKFWGLYEGNTQERLDAILQHNVYGVEIDSTLYLECLERIRVRWGYLPVHHNFVCQDFFRCAFADSVPTFNNPSGTLKFEYIIGNPPFGGTIDATLQDDLDRLLGFRYGEKIKKETYSFFIVKCVDLLARNGRLLFICSDTFMTINTMKGLRNLLMAEGNTTILPLSYFSEETQHPMVVLDFCKTGISDGIIVDGEFLPRSRIEQTGNLSWRVSTEFAQYFMGRLLGDYVVASSGMTVGKNEYFVREIRKGTIVEPYKFEFFDDPITVKRELERARLGKISPKKIADLQALEQAGKTRRNVRVTPRLSPVPLSIPHPDYYYYNKANGEIVYSPPTHAIYWKDEGDAVLTFKKNGNWYLHGVGGQPYFKRQGLTWQLISSSLNVRYLPENYILDSGAPCAFLREGVPDDELYFIMAWALTPLCNTILKEVINHTRNIQGKDFERLPYPTWVCEADKSAIIELMKTLVAEALAGRRVRREDQTLREMTKHFSYKPAYNSIPTAKKHASLYVGSLFDL